MAEKRNERKNPAAAAAGAVEKLVKGVGTVIGVTPRTAEKQKLPNRTKVLVSIVNHDDEKRLKEILDDTSVSASCSRARARRVPPSSTISASAARKSRSSSPSSPKAMKKASCGS